MPVDIHRVLFPTDFSEPAMQAQQYAKALVDRFGSELHVLHVVPEIAVAIPDSGTFWTMPDVDVKAQVDAAQSRIVRDLGEEWVASHKTVTSAVVGMALDEIVEYSKKHEIDLIVIGTHGYTGLSHLLLGSVAEKIVRISTCPVLTVHPKGHQFVS